MTGRCRCQAKNTVDNKGLTPTSFYLSTTSPFKALPDMGKDQEKLHTPGMGFAADIPVDDLPDDITALFNSFQEFYSVAEKQKAEDLTAIHSANLSMISSRIISIDEQIALLHSHREKLLSKRDEETRNVAILKSILSPIRRVPTDLLCEIFVRCLPEKSTREPINPLSANEAPLLLCRVCKKWRRTAIAFPYLWKALTLRASYAFDDETKLIVSVHPSLSPILDSWFARAGSCPLSLGLDIRNGHKEPLELTLKMKDVLDLLPNSRLQHFSLSVVYPSDAYFLSKLSQEFTQLESIFLQAMSGTDSLPVPHRLLQSAPRLRSAELHNLIQPWAFPKSWIPWSQLTHLRVEHQLGKKMWYILICHCTSLQHGIFSIDQEVNSDLAIPTSDHDTVLPHLVDLTVHISVDGEQPDFRQLIFPNLRRLQLLFEGPMSAGPIHLWDEHFLATDTSSLSSLIIIGAIDFTQPQLESLLNSARSITELHLSVGTNYIDFFKSLASSSRTQPLLPKLETLHCDIRDNEDSDAILQPLVSFVRSRWGDHPIARLRRLTLKFHLAIYEGGFLDRANELLEPLRDQDLSLVLDTWGDHSLNLWEMMEYLQE